MSGAPLPSGAVVAADTAAPEGPVTALPPGGLPWDLSLALTANDGTRLRGAIWNPGGPRGLALLLTGRTEFLEKASLPAAALVARGFAVASLDWRGQGLSTRLLDEPLKGHVARFEDYDRDLAALLAAPEVTRLGPPRLVFAHSMGGAITLGATARGLLPPLPLILSAPMADIAGRGLTALLMDQGARAARAIGLGRRWPPLPRPEVPYVFNGFDGNCLTGDERNYAWLTEALHAAPALQLGLPTLGWLAAAQGAVRQIAALPRDRVGPALICLGTREGVVDPDAVKALAARLGAGPLMLEGARHDLPIETADHRERLWAAADDFIAARL